MTEFFSYFTNRKNLTNLVVLLILVVAIPLGIYLAKNQQFFKSRAATDPISFFESQCIKVRNGKLVAVCEDLTFRLTSPIGPPGVEATSSGGISCNPSEADESVIRNTSSGWRVKDTKACKNGKQDITYQCIYTDNGKQKTKTRKLNDLACPTTTPSGSPTPPISPSPTATQSASPAPIVCNPDEKNELTIKSLTSGWIRGDVGNCNNKSLRKVKYSCTYQRNGNTRTQRRDVEETCTQSDVGGSSSWTNLQIVKNANAGSDDDLDRRDDDNNGTRSGQQKKKQCNDGKDNDGDGKIDTLDPGCHKDDDLSKEYIPTDNKEKDGKGGDKDKRKGFTTHYRYAENPTDLNAAAEIPYTIEPVDVLYSLKDKSLGVKTIFAEFIGRDDKGNVVREKRQASIELVAEDPVITDITCDNNTAGDGVILTINGLRFGTGKGEIKASTSANSNHSTNATDWTDTKVLVNVVGAKCSQTINITLIRTDKGEAKGVYGPSPLSLGAKLFCRRPMDNEVPNVDLSIIEGTPGAQLIKQNVTLTKEGLVNGLSYNFRRGQRYKIALKAPFSVRRQSKAFVFDGGTAQVILRKQDNYLDTVYYNVLPVGDIYPVGAGDGAINQFDKTILDTQWGQATTATLKTGDFNRDAWVNSVDWACMRYDFGSGDDAEPGAPICPAAPLCSGSQLVTGDPDPNDLNSCPTYQCVVTPPPTLSSPSVSASASASTSASPDVPVSASPSASSSATPTP